MSPWRTPMLPIANPSNRAGPSLPAWLTDAGAFAGLGASAPRWGAAMPSLMDRLTDIAPHKIWGRGLYHPRGRAVHRRSRPLMRPQATAIRALTRLPASPAPRKIIQWSQLL